MPPIWKRNPPCKAHKTLESMFKNNQISADATPSSVQKLHPNFAPFSSAVFRGAFNELRKSYGTELKLFNAAEGDPLPSASGVTSVFKRQKTCNSGAEARDFDSKIVHHNYPVLTSVFRDHETEQEKVIIVAALYGGSSNVKFSLVGSASGSSMAKITYDWPKIAYNVDWILKKKIDSGDLPLCHPKIIALKKELQNYGVTNHAIKSTPRGEITLHLPIPVETASDYISCSGGKTTDGSMIVIAELTAYQNSYSTVEHFEKTIEFEDL